MSDADAVESATFAIASRLGPIDVWVNNAMVRVFSPAALLRTELLHARSQLRVTMVHMPALNTPQFDWCRARVSHKPQPVAPLLDRYLG